ncbi:MAG: OmpA family protein [Myxococcales bacterium]|nr:OmpA family protein [Myxococcales bacterium]
MRSHSPFRSSAVAAAVALLAGCTTNPFTGESQVSKTATGAAIGGAAGAAIGAIAAKDHRGRGAAIGAGVGVLAGGAVGAYMDVQEAKLRQQLQGTGVSVTRVGDNLVLNLPGNVTFRTDSSDLRPDFFGTLNSVSLVLKEYQKTLIDVAGHADSTGDATYNQSLSQRRAVSVGEYLRSQGILAARIVERGYGETRPIASNATAQGREQNRRVELTLIPLT